MEHRAYTAMNDIDSFVDMFSCASGLPAWKLEGWLEIYFKLRVLQELEKDERQRENESGVEIVSAPAVPLPERSAPPPPPAPADDDPPPERKNSAVMVRGASARSLTGCTPPEARVLAPLNLLKLRATNLTAVKS